MMDRGRGLERIVVIEVRRDGVISRHQAFKEWSYEDPERKAERLLAMKERLLGRR